jgi:hypothetical protein
MSALRRHSLMLVLILTPLAAVLQPMSVGVHVANITKYVLLVFECKASIICVSGHGRTAPRRKRSGSLHRCMMVAGRQTKAHPPPPRSLFCAGSVQPPSTPQALPVPVPVQQQGSDSSLGAFDDSTPSAKQHPPVGSTPAAAPGPPAVAPVGATPLHVAVLEGKLDVVEALLAAGAEPDALNSAGAAPLHLAAQKGLVEVVSALLLQGADPNVKNAKGWGPVLVSLPLGGGVLVAAARVRGGCRPPPLVILVLTLAAALATHLPLLRCVAAVCIQRSPKSTAAVVLAKTNDCCCCCCCCRLPPAMARLTLC